MGTYTGTVPSFLAGELADATKLLEVTNFMTAATGAWTTWSPTLANLTLGNGTQIAKYRRLGNTVDFIWRFTLGSTSAVGTAPGFTLPVAASGDYTTYPPWFGMLADVSTSVRPPAVVNLSSSTTVIVQYFSSLNTVANLGAAVPFVWTTSDFLSVTASYYTA